MASASLVVQTRSGPASVVFRDALQDDYDGVLELGVYDGFDPLPARYEEYIRDPNRYMGVAEARGKVVAFSVVSVVDDGRRAVLEGVRVARDYQRHGVMLSACAWTLQRALDANPSLVTITYTSNEHSAALGKALLRDPRATLLTKRYVLCMETSPTGLKSFLTGRVRPPAPETATTVISPEMARGLLTRHELNTAKMVPEEIWISNTWEPFGLCDSNYGRMVTKDVVVTKETGTQTHVAISFADFCQCARGLLYFAHFYSEARGPESLPVIKSHILKHLSLLQKQCAHVERATLFLVVAEDAPIADIRSFSFDELGMEPVSAAITTNSGYFLECISSCLDLEKFKVGLTGSTQHP